MPRVSDVDWDSLDPVRQDAALDASRSIQRAESERVGACQDWRLRVAQIREAREERESERARKAAKTRLAQPGDRERRSEWMRKAWSEGKFSNRKAGCSKRTEWRVAKARSMRESGMTYSAVGEKLGVSVYTAMRWCGWSRKPVATNRKPVTIDGVEYPSRRSASRATGLDRDTIKRRFG